MTGAEAADVGRPAPGLGLVLALGPGPPDHWTRAASWFRDLEQSGCPAIWFTDHLFFPFSTPDATTMAAVAAASTTSCSIGTGVLQLPLRQVPAVAKAGATVATIAPGRFVLGVGSGELSEEYEKAGADFADRGRRLDAGLRELRHLWDPGSTWFEQRPAGGPIPIWIGGRSERALARVARSGNGWFPMFVSPEGFTRRSRMLDQHLTDAGRDPARVARAVLLLASVDRPGWTASDAHTWVSQLFHASPEALSRHVLTGSAEHVAAQIATYRGAGAEHVAILVADEDPLPTYTTLQPLVDGQL